MFGATVAAMMIGSGTLDPIELKAMTYNLRYATAQDGENSWPHRRVALLELVKKQNPDILGVQEALASQIDELRLALPGHDVVGVGRDDGIRAGEFSAIFYRRDRLGMRVGGTRWISETPDVPGSKGPGTTLPRVFAWGEFLVQGKRLLVMNAHFDHQSAAARLMGAEQMRNFAAEREGIPGMIMGDFNCNLGSAPLNALTGAGWFPCEPQSGSKVTFTGFDPGVLVGEAIDHILVTPGLRILETIINRTLTPDGRTPSDHYPVVVRFTLD